VATVGTDKSGGLWQVKRAGVHGGKVGGGQKVKIHDTGRLGKGKRAT